MANPAPRRSWFTAALFLLALAPSSRAAAAESGKPRRAASAVEDLTSDVARPDDFKRFVEGSRARSGDADAPRAFAQGAERPGSPAVRLSRPKAGPRPDGAEVPSTAAAAAGRGAPARKIAWTPDLAARKLAAVFGLGFMLIAASMLETPVESEPEAEPEPRAASPRPRSRPSSILPPEPSLAPSRLASALADPSFIDTRMPVPTWRAISQREQRLIDGWDGSPEKSLGLASLTEWLDAKGGAEGVDVSLLKTKLSREA